ncbi:MAG: transcriptional repressor [Dehalococcoidia bacterium]|nr:transcriptional repressor [Dehalococcoidia bacterium]
MVWAIAMSCRKDRSMSCEAETTTVLRDHGHRITPQRMLILSSLRHAAGHISASDILERVQRSYPYVDISTVYRTLSVLKDLHLVTETQMGGENATFEWLGPEPHHHLICRKCDQVTLLDHDHFTELASGILRETGFHPDIDHFAIFGLCAECREANQNESGPA